VKLEGTIHCEGPDCHGSTHVSVDAMAQGRLPHFLKLIEYGNADHEMAFCCIDCCMKWCARFEPPETRYLEGKPE